MTSYTITIRDAGLALWLGASVLPRERGRHFLFILPNKQALFWPEM